MDIDGIRDVPNAIFPFDVPHEDEQHFLTVLVGEYQYRWAIHEGISKDVVEESYFPIVFWRTSAITEDEVSTHSAMEMITRYIPRQALDLLYGKATNNNNNSKVPILTQPTIDGAVNYRRLQRIPAMTIYILLPHYLSDDMTLMAPVYLQAMFKSIPIKMRKIVVQDFFPTPYIDNTDSFYNDKNSEQLACIRAIDFLFGPNNALIIDGGGTLTLTVLGKKPYEGDMNINNSNNNNDVVVVDTMPTEENNNNNANENKMDIDKNGIENNVEQPKTTTGESENVMHESTETNAAAPTEQQQAESKDTQEGQTSSDVLNDNANEEGQTNNINVASNEQDTNMTNNSSLENTGSQNGNMSPEVGSSPNTKTNESLKTPERNAGGSISKTRGSPLRPINPDGFPLHILADTRALSITAKLRAMHEQTGALPDVDTLTVAEILQDVQNLNRLQIFARSTAEAMTAGVLRETSLLLRYSISEWVKNFIMNSKNNNGNYNYNNNTRPMICVTGMETNVISKLLGYDNSSLIDLKNENGSFEWVKSPKSNDEPESKEESSILKYRPTLHNDEVIDIEVRLIRHLAFHGVRWLLCQQNARKEQLIKNHVIEKLRQDIIGCRVAKEFEKYWCGHVVDIARYYNNNVILHSNNMEDDLFEIHYDDGDAEEVHITELYDILMLYTEKGETNKRAIKSDEDKEKNAIKIAHSLSIAKRLATESAKVREKLEKEEKVKAKKAAQTKKTSAKEKDAKKKEKEVEKEHDKEDEKEGKTEDDKEEEKAERNVDNDDKQHADESADEKIKKESEATPSKRPGRKRTRENDETDEQSKKKRGASKGKSSKPHFDAESWVGKRIAKYMDDDEDGTTELCFGIVTKYNKGSGRRKASWSVRFDIETKLQDFDRTEMEELFELYEAKKELDTDDKEKDHKEKENSSKKKKKQKKNKNFPDDFDPLSLLERRVAKYFDDEIYYGAVTKHLPAEKDYEDDFWTVMYDDGDAEDYDYKELTTLFDLYKKHPESEE